MQNPIDSLVPSIGDSSINKYVYFKQNFLPAAQDHCKMVSKVLVNPHFNKTVFVNPNYIPTNENLPVATSKIHINPRIQSIKPPDTSIRKILVNPKVLRNIPDVLHKNPVLVKSLENKSCEPLQKDQVKTAHLVPESLAAPPLPKRIRRLSVRSKFKIIRSHSRFKENEKNMVDEQKRKYNLPLKTFQVANKFKLDNRKNNIPIIAKRAKFVFVNKFVSTSDLAKSIPVKMNKSNKTKSSNLLNISGIIYKNSPNSLRRTSAATVKSKKIVKIQERSICKSKYKFIRRTSNPRNVSVDEKHTLTKCTRRSSKHKKLVLVEKLRICNIPCPYYKKFGKCKRKNIGKCHKKHDPDQIALCTKFLQGACIDNNCSLSHNVSSEKMPTCKYYLEGSCSRDHCPYIHVRISPKAEICRDFLEGFCRKALECDKRHQFLCPDYEKKGCVKPRCPYPHGKMVRKYSVFNKHKFAKKSSNNVEGKPCEKQTKFEFAKKKEITKLSKSGSSRYYLDKKNINEGETSEEPQSCVISTTDDICNQETAFRQRPKLGELPSFIAFEEK